MDGTAPTLLPGWSSELGSGTLLIVADGMGGHGGGDVASQSAVEAIASYLVDVLPRATSMLDSLPDDARTSLHGMRAKLADAMLAGDEAIRAQAKAANTPRMGTTLTMAFLAPPLLYVAHVGDSRCYILREGQLYQLTNDHTVANQISRMRGAKSDEAQNLHHLLWNCLGGGADVHPKPEVVRTDLLPTDSVLLCTDGLTNELGEPEILMELGSPGSAKDVCDRLVQAANARGGRDNITVVLARPA